MDVVEVNDIRADRTARLVEELLEVVRRLHLPPRHLGRDIHPVAPAPGEGFAYRLLALAAEINAPRVDVVHATLDGTAHHRRSLVEVHVPVFHGQAQHPEPQGRHFHACPPHVSVCHVGVIIQNTPTCFFFYRLFFCFLCYKFCRMDECSGRGCQQSFLDKISSVHAMLVV